MSQDDHTTDDPSELSKLPMPDDGTLPAAGGSSSLDETIAEMGESDSTPPLSGTNDSFDAAVARLAVKRGFASDEQIDAISIAVEHEPDQSFGELLVKLQALTPSQYERLRNDVESERTGQRIPGFTMLGKIGSGASATVFKARQTSLDRLVAIKVLPKRFSKHQEFIDRFYAEGRAAAQLNHPNIVQAYDVGNADDCYYFVMEFVQGDTVYELTQKTGTVGEERALEIVIELADALKHAHENDLIHRDVKPKNIIITSSGQSKLADLGLARTISDIEKAEAEAGQTFGTPYYMSPEQVRGDRDIGPPADIYGLGATFYHMLTGDPPFAGSSSKQVMESHLNEMPKPPDARNSNVSPGISDVVLKMLAKEIDQRYTDCAELLDELRAWKSFHILKRGEADRGAES